MTNKFETKLALFDFDGTISRKDSMVDFIQFLVGKRRYYNGLVKQSPMLLSYLLKRISNSDAKQALMAHYFSDYSTREFETLARTYGEQKLPRIIRPKALQRIQWHQAQKHRIVIVSASVEDWLTSWTEHINVELIASQLDKSKDHITGYLQGHNCHGIEKVRRIKHHLKLEDYSHIYAYGDSAGDKEMLALADEAHYKPFH
ncbi:HAD-IB family hydrolase [Marinicella gelatinilytica]|uniref:HAD-IB family hydrolase n=1 Tax=Marinicella gelatinilytica TaxID=2996017 RepID=UPI002260D6F6|nr:HAD-IB family hydrolase [Marinicella gelatinilytica]MCX7544472.1 HAD-IB family hydrolase [Marinicella gelatinilytica]